MAADALSWRLTPLQAMARWPDDIPLAALISGDDSQWSRWTVLAIPGAWHTLSSTASRGDVSAWLRRLMRDSQGDGEMPGDGASILQLSYELGAVFEPSTMARAREPDAWPLAQAAPVVTAAVHDARSGRWFRVGGPHEAWPEIERAMKHEAEPRYFSMNQLQPCQSDAHYADMVTRTREFIRQGDLFQANVARQWKAGGEGDPRAFAHAALEQSHARYGAWLETPAGMIASMSPELFLSVDRSGLVVTRPIKGTRPAGFRPDEFMACPKDAAELHMIVDLMRNDLSRACEPGSVHVAQPRIAESHETVLHGVAEIHGRLRRDRDLGDLIATSFPPGSITGAPKIRAMQVIRELEGFDRGPYCGAIGLLGGDGTLLLNVAIRSAQLKKSGGAWTLRYAAGCGITSDSIPDEEVAETHTKVAVLHQAMERLMSKAVALPAHAAPGA